MWFYWLVFNRTLSINEVLALILIFSLAQGVNTLWGSFEVTNTRLAKMQLKQFSAINLEDNLDQFDFYADKFQKLPMYYLTFHGAQEV